ncbi:unnamed protein product [Rhizoctonia solani]|uniref:CHAT domain-containing protein n=1 Tax=Rhizoctonia solani TaxID=456999 RepID=A0A8H2XJ93_9AGAM|nr:unnamed protein product [Rhizoctonia solani]
MDPRARFLEDRKAREYLLQGHNISIFPIGILENACLQLESAVQSAPDTMTTLDALIKLSHTYTQLAEANSSSSIRHIQTALSSVEQAMELYKLSYTDEDTETEARLYDALGGALLQRYIHADNREDCDQAVAAHRRSLGLTMRTVPSNIRSMRHYRLALSILISARGTTHYNYKPTQLLEEAYHLNLEALRLDRTNYMSYLLQGALFMEAGHHNAISVSTSNFSALESTESYNNSVRSYRFVLSQTKCAHTFTSAKLAYLGLELSVVAHFNWPEVFDYFANVLYNMLLDESESSWIDCRHALFLINLLSIFNQHRQMSSKTRSLVESLYRRLDVLLPTTHFERAELHHLFGDSLLVEQPALGRFGCIQDVSPSIWHHREALRLTPDGHPRQARYLITYINGLMGSQLAFDRTTKASDLNFMLQELETWLSALDMIGQQQGLPAGIHSGIFSALRPLMAALVLSKGPKVLSDEEITCLSQSNDKLMRFWLSAKDPSITQTYQSILRRVCFSNSFIGQLYDNSAFSVPNMGGKYIDESLGHWNELYTLTECTTDQAFIEFRIGECLLSKARKSARDFNFAECYKLTTEGLEHMSRSLQARTPATTMVDIIDMSVLGLTYAVHHSLTTPYTGSSAQLEVGMELLHLSVATAISLCIPAETIHPILEKWTDCAVKLNHDSVLDAYMGQTGVATQLSWVGFDVQTRYEHLLSIGSLAPDASVYACLKNSPVLAVEFLETFRSILFTQTLSLRNQQLELRASHSSLASELERIGKAIEMRSFENRAQLEQSDRFHPDLDRRHQETLELRTLGEEWDEVVRQIRRIPGYESFLQTPSIENLCQAANNGPVVMIVASEKHQACYAIVISGPSASDIHSMRLPLTIPKAEELSKRFNTNLFSAHLRKANTGTDYLQHEAGRGVKQIGKVSSECPKLGCHAVLKELWGLVMEPIIELVETHSPASCKDNLFHIWLIVAGSLSSLPLHAAGIYEPDGTTVNRCSVLDRVICSYTPSLSALNRKPPSELLSETKLFAFGGGQGLSAASKEVEAVRSICSPKMTVSVALPHATPEEIKKEMRSAHIVHFACHGTQDLANPLRSRLEFSHSSKIEVEELMSEPMPNARLAVLLACDQRLTEESLHLAGTMLFAGFYGAVGTLWKMEDKDGPIDNLVHIWLIVAGILSSLPLHAAGIYEPDGTTVNRCCVLDRVICSYTPSLSALNRKPPSELLSETKLFAFGGGQGLSAASREVEAVHSICSPKMTVSVALPHATPEGIKKEMRSAHIVHFACHGTQDLANPLRSRLEFSNSSKIEVEELMTEPMPNARLAVLLACETAQGDQRLTEESLHLAGTMLFAGFYGAVGTLWKMEDKDGPIVCEEFYKGLLEGDEKVVEYSKAGEALHRAVRDQRLTEESLHLAGTMLFAGFYGAVGTLWKMEDKDGPIVCEEFYKGLLEGDEKVVEYSKAGEALHRAVRKLKESGAHALRWASFVHIGR